jgi:hypothetical protein
MIYKISGSSKIPKKKAATFGYSEFETEDIHEFVEYINTHAVLPSKVKGGHRLTDNVEEIYGWIRLDVDIKGEAKRIDKALKKVMYIKKPSTSHLDNPYKWHYFIPIDNVSQSYDAYKLQYYEFLNEFNIDLSDKSLASVVQNTNPMGKDGVNLTVLNKGKVWKAPNKVAPKIIKLEKNSSLKTPKSKIKSALARISPNCSYKDWYTVGMALYDWCPKRGFKLYDKWSKGGDSYDGTTQDKWNDFSKNATGAVTVGSLMHLAYGEVDKFDNEQPLTKEKKEEIKKKKEKKVKKEKEEKKQLLADFDPYNVGGELTEDKLESMKNMRILYDNIIPEGQHTFIYGSAGAMKTTLLSWICIEVLKKYKEKIVHNWSFDASTNHQASIFQYGVDENVSERFKLYDQHTIDDYHTHYDMAIEKGARLDRLLILIDTYKFVTTDVNSKAANKKALHYIKQLTALGATVVSLGHTNKDGLKNSGTAEVEQDSDNVLRINRAVDEFSKNVTLTIEAAGRTRFNCSPTSFKLAPEGSNYDYLYSALQTTQELDVAVDLTAVVSEETRDNKSEKIKELKDRPIVNAIAKVIDEMANSNNVMLKPTQPIIVKEMKERESLSKAKVDTILREYNGTRWKYKDVKDKRTKKMVKHFKLIKHE